MCEDGEGAGDIDEALGEKDGEELGGFADGLGLGDGSTGSAMEKFKESTIWLPLMSVN
jgi:hypothetical protein